MHCRARLSRRSRNRIMQTFLPYKSFEKSARCLDYRRLGKQRVEAYQILRVLEGKSTGWCSHPAVLMWKDHEDSLREYMAEMIFEWVRRGYRNTMKVPNIVWRKNPPSWLTSKFIRAHRSNLVRKDPKFYSKYKWGVGGSLPYVWPIRIGEKHG